MRHVAFCLAFFVSAFWALSSYADQAYATKTQLTFTATTTPSTIAVAEPYLANLLIQNTGGGDLVVKFGSCPSSVTDGFIISSNGAYDTTKPTRELICVRSVTGSVTGRLVEQL